MLRSISPLFAKLMLAAVLVTGFTAVPQDAFADGWFSCQPTEVIELSNRVHVRCSNSWWSGSSSIRYIAINKSSNETLKRFISYANAALLSNKFFRVYLRSSSSTNVSGCLSSDCRTPTAYGVMNR